MLLSNALQYMYKVIIFWYYIPRMHGSDEVAVIFRHNYTHAKALNTFA